MAKILLLEDELHTRRVISLHLVKLGHEVVTGEDGREGLDHLARGRFDLVITDLRMPRMSGMEMLKAAHGAGLKTPMIVLTAYASIESAVEAMKLGAADYIGKPPQLDEITIKVTNLLAQQELAAENRRLKDVLADRYRPEGVIGRSAEMKQLLEGMMVLARDPDIAILLTGESGTGKELIARTIHHQSPRADRPFIAINCGALPETLLESELFGHEKGAFTGALTEKKGLFEAAHRGTLLLDEVSAMTPAMQVKLLRALEEREIRRVGGLKSIPVNLRIISASNSDLRQLVDGGSFRPDLYFRLAVATIPLPPLRERRGDVPLLIDHFLAKFNREKTKTLGMEREAVTILESYRWPGNVRELQHLIEMLVVTVTSETITVMHLPETLRGEVTAHATGGGSKEFGDDLKEATKFMTGRFERGFILHQLEKYHWNVTQTAQAIGLSRAALHAKMKEYDIGR